jgi:succinate dehydrogenase / fumarate reductase, flavoprotein subunit
MYERIMGEDPYKVPMMIYPAVHYTMGGLWVDYNLMSTIPGLFVLGEANFSDHGANRLGASALMQGLADGYFVIPSTLPNYFASTELPKITTDATSLTTRRPRPRPGSTPHQEQRQKDPCAPSIANWDISMG